MPPLKKPKPALKILLKSLFLATITFVIHMVIGTILSFIVPPSQAYISYGVIGSIIYIFVFAFWAYIAFSFLYLLLAERTKNVTTRYIISFILMIIAYVLYRTGDIIDGDFMQRFKFFPFLVFLLTGPMMVLIASIIDNKGFTNAKIN